MSALTDWLTGIADAIRAKEESVDPIPHAAFPSRIAGLQAGGDWKPEDWPDIEAIVDADVQAGYTHKYIYLIADDYSYVDLFIGSGRTAFKTSDGAFYATTTQHTWDTSQDFPCSEGYKTRWVIVYTASENQDVSIPYETLWVDSGSVKFGRSGFSSKRRLRGVTGEFQQLTNASEMFFECYSLTKVPDILDLSHCIESYAMFGGCYSLTKVPDVLDLSQCESTFGMFGGCYSLTKVPDILDLSQCLETTAMFFECYSLTKVPDILDLSHCYEAAAMFNNCYSLTKVPDILDLSQCLECSDMFLGCHSLLKTPQLIVSPTSAARITFDFSSCVRINAEHRDSVAAFTGASLTGGMVYHLPTVTNARTLTLNDIIKNLFTTGEQAEIDSHLMGKNWDLSWTGGGTIR